METNSMVLPINIIIIVQRVETTFLYIKNIYFFVTSCSLKLIKQRSTTHSGLYVAKNINAYKRI